MKDGARQALLLGSTLRGVLRHDLRRLLPAWGEQCCELRADCQCLACHLFGAPGRPGKIAVRSSMAPATQPHVITRVAIDRHRRTALRTSKALWSESRLQADFTVALEAMTELASAEVRAIELLLSWEQATGIRLGYARRSGAGLFALSWSRSKAAEPAPPGLRTGQSERLRYTLRLTAEEPLRVLGLRQRAFLSVSSETVPATTVRGAIGWALARAGADDVAVDLFNKRPIRISGAVPLREQTKRQSFAGTLACRAGHLMDTTAAQVAIALGYSAKWPFDCPTCSAPLKVPKGLPPERLLLGHSAMDPGTLRPALGQLFYQLTLVPGTVLIAEAEMTPDQATTIASLQHVLVGGGRARGTGRARIEVKQQEALPHLHQRLSLCAEALKAQGVLDPEGIAVLAFVADGWCGEPFSDLLARRGLVFVTGNGRRVLQGSWDMQADTQRPLRALIGAGSWAAVRGPLEAVAELETNGVADPFGTHPLWLRARDLKEEAS